MATSSRAQSQAGGAELGRATSKEELPRVGLRVFAEIDVERLMQIGGELRRQRGAIEPGEEDDARLEPRVLGTGTPPFVPAGIGSGMVRAPADELAFGLVLQAIHLPDDGATRLEALAVDQDLCPTGLQHRYQAPPDPCALLVCIADEYLHAHLRNKGILRLEYIAGGTPFPQPCGSRICGVGHRARQRA